MSRFKPSFNSQSVLKLPKRRAPEPPSAAPAQPESHPLLALQNVTVEDVESGNSVQGIGFGLLLLFLFFKFSFYHELVTDKLHVDLHIIIILSTLILLAALGSGRLGQAFRHRIVHLWIGFMICAMIATITSVWPGGSADVVVTYLRTSFPIIFIFPALVASKRNLSRAMSVLGLAGIALALLGLLNSDFKTGRMDLNQEGSEIQNSNDYAAYLVLLLPPLAYLTMNPGRPKWMRAVGLLSVAISVYEILSTGSRGGLVGMMVMLVFVAAISGPRVKFGLLIGVPVLTLAAIPFVPASSMVRLKSVFGSGAGSSDAAESKEQRMALLEASLRITLTHPLTGIGPAQFMVAEAGEASARGERGMWHVTHNTYTQVSCECGIPAAICFFSAMYLGWREMWRRRKHPDPNIRAIAATGCVMMTGFGTCIFFLSDAYSIQILILTMFGLSLKMLAPLDETAVDLPLPRRAVPA